MKRNKLTAENLKVLGSANSRFTTSVVAFDASKDAGKITQNSASMGITLNEGDEFIINDLVMTVVTPAGKNAKPFNTLALAISRVINGEVSKEVELLPTSRFVNTLVDIDDNAVEQAKARISSEDASKYQEFIDYVQEVRTDASKVFYKGEGAVNFGKKLMELGGTADEANVFTVDKRHSHSATFNYGAEQQKATGKDTFVANQQFYILSV